MSRGSSETEKRDLHSCQTEAVIVICSLVDRSKFY